MKGERWPEAEPYIMKVPELAYVYARFAIQGRWPEAEPYIMQWHVAAANYLIYVVKGQRCLEGLSHFLRS